MAYKKAIIAIPNVTGNIVINVTTQGSVQNLFDVTNSVLNSRIGATGDVKSAGDRPGMIVTNPIDVDGIDTLNISGITEVLNTSLSYYLRVATYDSSNTNITAVNYNAARYSYDVAGARQAHSNTKYVRFGISLKDGVSISASDVANLVISGS